ncbi:oligopeptide/dipeptide ABC transporter, ATP-binding protein, C-terminal domain-containing protein [Actinacidiphila yanglinensis]|uniref:Oligopeptide/dipeptide ABC transporter, ATP-binding protein, C-terminal domain-containing protein n=1 Tax=Actinacidiphila yanglinensis TaxID=310779 RepID=A0A1H5V3S4_9ACTN|nr:dipeptide ABC transporter ATP-binding protein [Actinacidiphila yanglinensis]SEF82112.1 oligopeptide/dipeptide ABC transporter, ATP-binding protein, C-terminal domain-containing protein [Actinacidiphila yanglinensis]
MSEEQQKPSLEKGATADAAPEADKAVPAQRPETGERLLEVTGMRKYFPINGGFVFQRRVGDVRAVDGIDFHIDKGEALGMVGESGCGKSTTGRLVTRLLEPTDGKVAYAGQDITHASRRQLAPIRSEIQMIFQDPYASLNPRQTVGNIISAPMEINGINPTGGREKRVRELLETVGLNPEHYNRFPHEFSGGQRQRIGVARALSVNPKLIVADEPVSALDVSIQAQVVNLLQQVQKELGIAFLFIAHDLAIVRHFSQRIAVMYLGKIVEIGDRESIYVKPRHPYTHALLSAAPEADPDDKGRERIRLAGDVPSPINPPSGCRFRTRCWKAQDLCADEEPPLIQLGGSSEGHLTACHFPEEPTVTARAEDIILDPALAGAEEAADKTL